MSVLSFEMTAKEASRTVIKKEYSETLKLVMKADSIYCSLGKEEREAHKADLESLMEMRYEAHIGLHDYQMAVYDAQEICKIKGRETSGLVKMAHVLRKLSRYQDAKTYLEYALLHHQGSKLEAKLLINSVESDIKIAAEGKKSNMENGGSHGDLAGLSTAAAVIDVPNVEEFMYQLVHGEVMPEVPPEPVEEEKIELSPENAHEVSDDALAQQKEREAASEKDAGWVDRMKHKLATSQAQSAQCVDAFVANLAMHVISFCLCFFAFGARSLFGPEFLSLFLTLSMVVTVYGGLAIYCNNGQRNAVSEFIIVFPLTDKMCFGVPLSVFASLALVLSYV